MMAELSSQASHILNLAKHYEYVISGADFDPDHLAGLNYANGLIAAARLIADQMTEYRASDEVIEAVTNAKGTDDL